MFATIDNHVRGLVGLSFGMLAAACLTSCVDHKVDPGYCGACTDANVGDAMAGGDAKVDGAAAGNGGGGGTAGNGASGSGANDAAVDGSTDAGQDATMVDAGPCGMTCPAEKPVCDEASNKCVQCLNANDCTGSTPACDTGAHQCVECAADTDCKAPLDSRCAKSTHTCQPCKMDSQCEHIADKNVCDDGACVQCTGKKYNACGKDAMDKQLVCDSANRVCSTTATEQSIGLCQTCITDAQCGLGQLCVKETFADTDIGYFCFWQKNAGAGGAPTACSSAQPFVKTTANTTSIDKTVGDICELTLTTCPGHNDFRSADANCEATPDVPNDSLCGAPGVADAYCRKYDMDGADNLYRCTMPCGTNDDCVSGFTCDTAATPRICKFF